MKISKLFHWLYGILMLLPCFAILVKCAYVAFNKNAYESYSGTSTQYVQKTLQTNEVNTLDDLHIGSYYHFYVNNKTIDEILYFNNFYFLFELHNVLEYDFTNYTFEVSDFVYLNEENINGNISIRLYANTDYTEFQFFFNNNVDYFYAIDAEVLADYEFTINCDIKVIDLDYVDNNLTEGFFTSTQMYEYEEVEVSTLDNVFYYAVDEVCNNDLFAWASNSFLNAPLTYITNLFNMPTDNAVILLMSYWFNISIIWLCFDVMIYVPLLVHRWLDKGIVE